MQFQSICAINNISPVAHSWLTQADRLTRYLRASGEYQFVRLQQGFSGHQFQRKILHKLKGRSVVYAEVTMPQSTYDALSIPWGALMDLPIGEAILYHNESVTRSDFEYACFEGEGIGIDLCPEKFKYARRSVFHWKGHPLTITEYFVQDMPALPLISKTAQRWEGVRARLRNYGQLMRLHRPMPIGLMAFPTLLALFLASHGWPGWTLFLIFMAGIVVMRSAGDVVNDLADRHWDGKVARTRLRPLVTGRVRVRNAWILLGMLLGLALGLVLMLNFLSLIYALVGCALALVYPLMKRVTHFPQVILGMAYNFGILLAFAAVQNQAPALAWVLWLGSIFWCVAYDTEYALADRVDDLHIGIKSTAVFFGRYASVWIGVFQAVTIGLYLAVGMLAHLGWIFEGAVLGMIPFFLYQQTLIQGNDPKRCIQAFNHNFWPMLMVFGVGVCLS